MFWCSYDYLPRHRNPEPHGPGTAMTSAAARQISDVLKRQNAIQRDKIARGETPDYYPDAPLPRRRKRHHNYP